MSARLKFVLKVSEGDFLKKDGAKTAFLYKANKERKRIVVGLSRIGSAPGASGHGTLVSVTFKAVRAGQTTLSFQKIDFRNSRHAPIQVRTESVRIKIAE